MPQWAGRQCSALGHDGIVSCPVVEQLRGSVHREAPVVGASVP
jgi:hypothetical protein